MVSYNNSRPSEKEKIDPNFFYLNILVIKYIITPGNNSNLLKKSMGELHPVSSGTNYDSINRTSTKQVNKLLK